MKQLYFGKWHCVRKEFVDQCCSCGSKEFVQMKVDRQGKIWRRLLEEGPMSGYGNYKNRVSELLKFIETNPDMSREVILDRLGRKFEYAFNVSRDRKLIVPSPKSTYKIKTWRVNDNTITYK